MNRNHSARLTETANSEPPPPPPERPDSPTPTLVSRLLESWPTNRWADVTVIVALSGGADSTALLRALTALRPADAKGRLIAAHFNHGRRGSESDGDEAFVGELCRQLGIALETGRNSAGDASRSEESARKARYAFLAASADRCGARYVATAHTADDQVETILFRMLRGTGVGGLGGMKFARHLTGGATLIRPLLHVQRADVVAYLESLGQTYRTDSSNADVRYTRNRLRNELLPLLRHQFNPGIDDALLGLAHQASEIMDDVRRRAEELSDVAVQMQSDGFVIDSRKIPDAVPRFILREMLVQLWRSRDWPLGEMTFSHWERMATLLLDHADATTTLPGNVRVEKKSGSLSAIRLKVIEFPNRDD